jgi:hypothetical protein
VKEEVLWKRHPSIRDFIVDIFQTLYLPGICVFSPDGEVEMAPASLHIVGDQP